MINLKNAVLYKDMCVNSKKQNLPLTIMILNLTATFIAMIICLSANRLIMSSSGFDPQTFTYIFDGFIITECALMCFLLPSITGPSIVGERERQTFDVLLTTNMSYFEIILGKFLSALSYMLLIVFSLLPFSAIILAYGAISLFQLFCVFLGMTVCGVFLAAVGILSSSISKKSSQATVLCFLLFGALVFVSIFLTSITMVFFNFLANIQTQLNPGATFFINPDWFMAILLINPATTVFDILDRTVGLTTELGGASGMGFFMDAFCRTHDSDWWLSKGWFLIASVVQLLLSYLMLRWASHIINPAKKKTKKKHDRKK